MAVSVSGSIAVSLRYTVYKLEKIYYPGQCLIIPYRGIQLSVLFQRHWFTWNESRGETGRERGHIRNNTRYLRFPTQPYPRHIVSFGSYL